MDNRPIGVFDSGLGGLTAVKELINQLPRERIVYFGDTGRVPYGSRSRKTILKYAAQDTEFLASFGVKMIIAACGTVSSVVGEIGDSLAVPFTGVVRPTAAAAAQATRNGKIGIIGTTATIKSGSYTKALKRLEPSLAVFEQDCPLFVPLVESGFISPQDPIVSLTIERYLLPMVREGIDTLILGCTHYPILRPAITQVIGEKIQLIDSGRETAIYAAKFLQKNKLLSDSVEDGDYEFFVSDSTEGFSRVAKLYLGGDVNYTVSKVDLEA